MSLKRLRRSGRMKRMAGLGYLFALLVGATTAHAVRLDEMAEIDRTMFEIDQETGAKYLVVKVVPRGTPINILTATTTVVKSGPGHLNNLIAVGGTMGNVTVYDNTAASGTVLWGPGTPAAGARILENIEYSVGLTIMTAAAAALSGSFR
jgi:hypothetical protein